MQSIIFSIADAQAQRGFLPENASDSQELQTPAFANRIWGGPTEEQEKVQQAIHNTDEKQPSQNAWYLTDIKNCKKALDGILKANAVWNLKLEQVSKTLCYLTMHGYLTPMESHAYHIAFNEAEWPRMTVCLGLSDSQLMGATAIYFSLIIDAADESEKERLLSVSADQIHDNIRKELNRRHERHIPTYMSVGTGGAYMHVKETRRVLDAMLNAEWKMKRPFYCMTTNVPDETSFRRTFTLLTERNILSSEEASEYIKKFFS